MRNNRRKAWVSDIWGAIPKAQRNQIPIREIDQLVEVTTWNNKGESFEFAHFTNRQIAKAILAVYQGPSAPTLSDLQARIDIIRKHADNLKNIWKQWKGLKPTKVNLAEVLWPTLERRIRKGLTHNSYRKIPVVKIALLAAKRANQLHRNSVMIRRK